MMESPGRPPGPLRGRKRASPPEVLAIVVATVVAFGITGAPRLAAQPSGPAQPAQPARPAEPARPVTEQPPQASVPLIRTAANVLAPPTRDQLRELGPVLRAPAGTGIEVRHDIPYRTVNRDTLRFDLYTPAGPAKPRPAVIFVSGGSDPRDWAMLRGYGRLAAAQGLVGIVYAKRYERSEVTEGAEDTGVLLDFLRDRGDRYGVDPSRLVMWGFSSGARLLAVGMDTRRPEVRALVSFYGEMDMSDELPFYPDSLRAIVRRLASPVHALQDRPESVPPTLLVRAGRDEPLLNSGINRFVNFALEGGRSVELINVAEGGRGFDLLQDREESRRVIRRAFRFVLEQVGESGP